MSQKWFNNIDLQQNELQNGVIQNLAADPTSGKAGQIYYNTTDKGYRYYNGTAWMSITAEAVKSIVAGDGLTGGGTGTVTINLGTPSASGSGSNTYGSNSVTDDSHTHQIKLPDASESAKGVIELATDAEAETGTDTTRAINAKQLAAAKQSAIDSAKVTIQTSNGITGGSTTPGNSFTLSGVNASTEAKGVVQLAADNDTTSTDKAVTPKQLETARKKAEVSITAGNGLTGGGTGHSLSVAMGTPSTVNQTTTNSTTATSHTHELKFNVVNSPAASGDEISFINTVSQGANGGISATKKTVRSASTTQTGVVQLATDDEVNTGTDNTKVITPATLGKGKASGVASLDANSKIITSQLPDYLLGQVMYGGNASTVAATTIVSPSDSLKTKKNITVTSISIENSATSTKDNTYGYKDMEGVYFICQASGTFAGNSFETGDWIISTGSAWEKIDNTDAVTSVNGQTGTVNITRVNEAGTADKLKTARTIALTGDATGSTTFDGSINKDINVTLANTGVMPGTYNNVKVDAKGRVTTGFNTARFSKFVYTFTGDNTTKIFDISHSLEADVIVQVYLTGQTVGSDTVDELIMVDTYTLNKKVKLIFATAPTTSQMFKVVVMGSESNIGTLEDTDWATIHNIVSSGEAANYWNVGDTKTVTSKSGKTYTVRLVDLQKNRYDYSDGSGGSKAVFEFVQLYNLNGTTGWPMNSSGRNSGGWAQSLMRTSTMPAILDDLPNDLVSAISQVKVLSGIGGTDETHMSSSDNMLFLPAQRELYSRNAFGTPSGIEESPLGQFDYYKANDIDAMKIKQIVGTTTANPWWMRSPIGKSAFQFSRVGADGSGTFSDAEKSYAISPCFAI